MITRRFALDKRGKKVYIGSTVKLVRDVRPEKKKGSGTRNRHISIFLIEDMNYLEWSTDQYLTLVDQDNKNKKLEFVSPNDILRVKAFP